MSSKHTLPIRVISSIVLCFFCWTFCICEIPNALANSQQSGNSNQQSAISSQSAQPKPLKSEERFQKAIDDITQIVSDTSTDTDTKKNKLKTKSETDASISRAKSHLEKVKAPSKHVPLDPNKLPFTSPEIKTFERIEK